MEALTTVAVIAGLVWAAVLMLRGSLVTSCLVFLLVNACFGYFFYSQRIGPVEVTLDRLVLIAVIGAYAIHRCVGRTDPKPLGTGDKLTLAFVAWLTLRTFTAAWWIAPPGFVLPVWHLFVGYLSPLVIYWIARQAPLGERSIRHVQLFFIALGVYLAVTAVAEVTGQWWAVFPRHIADPTVGLHFGRARGPMVQSIVLGFCLSISAACVWLYRDQLGWRGRLLLTACLPLMLLGALLTYTRGVWLGAGLAVMVVVSLTLPRRAAAVLTLGVLTVGMAVVGTQWDRIMNLDAGRSAAQSRDSTYMRGAFTYVSWQMFKDHPVLGVGLGQYEEEKDAYLSDRSSDLRLEGLRGQLLHNLFLSILVETGLVGLLLFLGMLGFWTRDAWRLWSDRSLPAWARQHGLLLLAVICAYIPNALFQPLGHMNIVHMMFFFLAGISEGLSVRLHPERVATRRQIAVHPDVAVASC